MLPVHSRPDRLERARRGQRAEGPKGQGLPLGSTKYSRTRISVFWFWPWASGCTVTCGILMIGTSWGNTDVAERRPEASDDRSDTSDHPNPSQALTVRLRIIPHFGIITYRTFWETVKQDHIHPHSSYSYTHSHSYSYVAQYKKGPASQNVQWINMNNESVRMQVNHFKHQNNKKLFNFFRRQSLGTRQMLRC